jgi:hypothetical protein
LRAIISPKIRNGTKPTRMIFRKMRFGLRCRNLLDGDDHVTPSRLPSFEPNTGLGIQNSAHRVPPFVVVATDQVGRLAGASLFGIRTTGDQGLCCEPAETDRADETACSQHDRKAEPARVCRVPADSHVQRLADISALRPLDVADHNVPAAEP